MNVGLAILLALVVGWMLLVNRPVKGVRSIPGSELPRCLADADCLLVDVREPYEYKGGHVKGTKNIPLGQITQRLGELPREREIVLICRSGHRSLMAARKLKKLGYERVGSVRGGMASWKGGVVT